MPSPIFLDANIPIYAAGRPHPLKAPCIQILTYAAQYPHSFITDVEVVQEILHHYRRHWPLGRSALQDFLLVLSGRIVGIEPPDASAVIALADQYSGLSARDLLHLAVMQRLGVSVISTADADYDQVPSLSRLDPARLGTWQHMIDTSGPSNP
jgi:predicted nucleic acid-binding protein